MFHLIARSWVLVVVVLTLTGGALAVVRLRGVFGSDPIFTAAGHAAEPNVAFNPKHVTYELFGAADTQGKVTYLNEDSQPVDTDFSTLPWRQTITTAIPSVIANVVAQGNSDHLGCRITVNGTVQDQQDALGAHAQTFCLVKAA